MLSFERAWARVALETFAPPGTGPLSPAAGEVDVVEAIETLQAHTNGLARSGLRAALWLVSAGPWLVLESPKPLWMLPLERRQEVLAKLLEHRVFAIREAAFLMKTAASLALLRSEALRARSGYDDPSGAP